MARVRLGDNEWRTPTLRRRLAGIGADLAVGLIGFLVWLPIILYLDGSKDVPDVMSDAILWLSVSCVAAYPTACNTFGTSPGKWIAGLALVDGVGRRPGVRTGLRRAPLPPATGLGYLRILRDPHRRASHDHAAGTWVVHHSRRRLPEPPTDPGWAGWPDWGVIAGGVVALAALMLAVDRIIRP